MDFMDLGGKKKKKSKFISLRTSANQSQIMLPSDACRSYSLKIPDFDRHMQTTQSTLNISGLAQTRQCLYGQHLHTSRCYPHLGKQFGMGFNEKAI